MKRNNLFRIICLSFFVVCLAGCESENIAMPETTKDAYLSPIMPQGKITIIATNPRYYPYLGAGYDIMGDYLDNGSVKEPVLDLKKVPDHLMRSTELHIGHYSSYFGDNATNFLKLLGSENDFILPTENADDLLFTGTIYNGFSNPYHYSTQYSFACEQSEKIESKHNFYYREIDELLPYLSDEFKRGINLFSADELIETFGTHVLTTTYLGSRIRTMYRSVVADQGERALHALVEGLRSRQATIYTLDGIYYEASKEQVTKNYAGRIIVGFHGGDSESLSLNKIQVGLNEISGGPIDITKWRASLNESNMGLVTLSARDLTPIYDFITDPGKKQQVKDAVQAHIKARQLKIIETAPIFQASNGKHHRYFSSYQTYIDKKDPSYACQVIATLYVKQEEGTVPLYRFSNENCDRLSLDKNEPKGMRYEGIIGYVYKEYQSLEPFSIDCLYEIWNGTDYAYTTEDEELYGEKRGWKKTGVQFYVKKTSILYNY